MIPWIHVPDSTRIVAQAYDPATETIYVRFPNGVEWLYAACPPYIWEEFTAPGQSRGRFIYAVLNHKPNRRFFG
jgi:hypothetical protein